MNDFLEFSELVTEPVEVHDAEGRPHRMFAMRLIAFRPLGHPEGDQAVLPTVHIAEHQLKEFLAALAAKVQQYFPETTAGEQSVADFSGPIRH